MLIRVKDGTGAGRRWIVDLPVWRCVCGFKHPGHRYSCASCGTRRP